MTISYDVNIMQELLRACQTANDELQRAQSKIQEVHSHDDWSCKEKDAIDDLMQDCKGFVKRLCEEQFSFLDAVKSVENELRDAENSVSRLFDGVEAILGKMLAIPVAKSVVSGIGLLGDKIENAVTGEGQKSLINLSDAEIKEMIKGLKPIVPKWGTGFIPLELPKPQMIPWPGQGQKIDLDKFEPMEMINAEPMFIREFVEPIKIVEADKLEF